MLQLLVSEVSIIVATPYMEEAVLCNRVAFIQEGKILQVDTPDEIITSFSKPLFKISSENRFTLIHTLKAYPFADSVYVFGTGIHYTDRRGNPDMDHLRDYLKNEGLKGVEIQPILPGIEDSFMLQMSKEIHE